MSFCKKCGGKLEEGERFCGSCGTQSINSVQSGNNSNFEQLQPQVSSVNTEQAKIYISNILIVTKDMLLKPVTTITNVSRLLSNEATYIMVVLLSIVFGLLNNWMFKSLSTNVSSGIKRSYSVFGLGGGMASAYGLGTINYGKIFFFMFFIFILGIAVLVIFNLVIGKYVFKINVSYINLVKVVTSAVIPFVAGYLFQIIFGYISNYLGLIMMFTGTIVSLISMFKGLSKELNVSEDLMIFIVPISYLVMFVCQYQLINVLIKQITNKIF